jgi:hypothetical protein
MPPLRQPGSPARAGCSRNMLILPLLVEHLMDKGNRDRPLAHGRRHALDVSSPDVPYREHTRQTRFEEKRGPGRRPMRGGQVVLRQIRSRPDEPFRIERNTPIEPLRAGNGAGHDEDVPDFVGFDAPDLIVPPANSLKMALALQGYDLRIGSDRDGRRLFNPANQVS